MRQGSRCVPRAARSHRSFSFLFLMISALSICTKRYVKGTNLVVARRMDVGCLEIGPPAPWGPHADAE